MRRFRGHKIVLSRGQEPMTAWYFQIRNPQGAVVGCGKFGAASPDEARIEGTIRALDILNHSAELRVCQLEIMGRQDGVQTEIVESIKGVGPIHLVL
jgi:hypothetical protein